LFKRNSAAEAELESNIKNLLHHMDVQKGNVGRKAGPLDEDEVAELQEQVALYREQLDIVASQKLELEADANRARNALAEVRAERDNYWSNEIKKLQAQIAAMRQERDRLAHSSSNLSQTQLELSSLQKEHAALQKQFLQSQVEMEALEKELEAANEKERTSSASLLHAERDLESLLKTLQGLERDLEEARAKEVASVKRESDTLGRMEAMRIEKAQAQLREQNCQRDLARLEEKSQFDLAQAHQRAEEEVAALYARSKEQEERLQGDIASLSLVVAELEAQKDKLQRESTHLRSQTDQVVSQLQNELLTSKSALSGAQSQLSEMHLTAEAHLAKLRRGEAELSRVQEFAAKERQALQESLHAYKLKNENLTLANQNLNVQVGRLSDNVARLERDLAEQKRVSDLTIGRLQSQLTEVEAARKTQVDELQQRLEEAYRMHESSEARTRELLAAQDTLSSKWREENKHVRAHLGKLLTEEKVITAGLHQRLTELEARCHQLVRERDQAMNFQQQYEQLKASHEATVGELGHRINVLTGELSTYCAREPEYLLAAKTLQGKVRHI
jgi:chromosome segregation ATPase